jgi:basic amino acid/polyamine antiporter, APA family
MSCWDPLAGILSNQAPFCRASINHPQELLELLNIPSLLQKLSRRKTAQALIDGAAQSDVAFKKTLSSIELTAFGVGATIGSGIFALTGTAAAGQAEPARDWLSTPLINFVLGGSTGREGAGPAIIFSFVIAAIACGFAALAYAELASMIPVSGSAYTFAYASFGQAVAWIIGWDLILEYAVGNIAVAISWSDYFLNFLNSAFGIKLPLWLCTDTGTAILRARLIAESPTSLPSASAFSTIVIPHLCGTPLALNLPAFVIVAIITWVLLIGVSESALVNGIAVFVKISAVLVFVLLGAGHINPENWTPFCPHGWASIMGGAAIVFFSFIGFDAVSSTAEETKNPQRDLPVAMIATLVICTLLYVAVSLVLTGVMPYQKYTNDAAPVASALASIGVGWAQVLVNLGALAGMTSVLLVFQLGQPRILMAMARDKLLPPLFAKLHPRYKTPFLPTLLTGIFVGGFALFTDIAQAAELTNIGTLAAFMIVCAGVVILRKTDSARYRAFRCPGVPLLPALGILSCSILMISLPVITWIRFFGWMALGMVLYFSYGFRR